MVLNFNALFSVPKPIIGMIHSAGSGKDEKVKRALEELTIYEEEGVDGAIIEDYHGDQKDVYDILSKAHRKNFKMTIGVNVLNNPYLAFGYASVFGGKFVQFDSVQTADLDIVLYNQNRGWHPNIYVIGGVRFKYTKDTDNPLEQDLVEARNRCEAIVTTGRGIGIETPLDKLRVFKRHLKDFPLIVGAGVTAENVHAQLSIADAAIIGSYFKPEFNTELPVERDRVRELMRNVRALRI